MNTELQIFNYNNNAVRTIDQDGETWFVGKDVCKTLEIADHIQAIESLDEDERGRYNVPTPSGNQDMLAISESGLYSLILRSRKPEAKAFKRWITHEVIPSIRKAGYYKASQAEPSLELEKLQDENALLRHKLQIFEEYNEDNLYDFDQAAGLVAHYRKPPFGQNHLKRWLESRGVLCNPHYKCDKPIQKYLDLKWFKAVVHEWFRKGKRRYETRYLFTHKGLSGIVDMAIRENMIRLPAPKEYCLPGMYDDGIMFEATRAAHNRSIGERENNLPNKPR